MGQVWGVPGSYRTKSNIDFPTCHDPQVLTCFHHTKGGGSGREVTGPRWIIPTPGLYAFIPLTLHCLAPGTGLEMGGMGWSLCWPPTQDLTV